MKAPVLTAAILAALCLPAAADMVYTDGDGDSVRIPEETSACPPEIATRAPQGTRGYYRAASVTIDGVSRRACAALVGVRTHPGVPFVHVIVEGGGDDIFPTTLFKSAPAAKDI